MPTVDALAKLSATDAPLNETLAGEPFDETTNDGAEIKFEADTT